MADRPRAVFEAFKELTEHEQNVAYLAIEKVWRAPYAGPGQRPRTTTTAVPAIVQTRLHHTAQRGQSPQVALPSTASLALPGRQKGGL
jgi:hypothetical protein